MKNKKLLCIIPLIVCLSVLMFPVAASAQVHKDSLILNYASGGFNNEIKPGETVKVYIEAANESSTATNHVQFSAEPPENWIVAFDPQSIETLGADSLQTVEVTIAAPENAQKGDYSVTIVANSSAGQRVMSLYFWVEKGSSMWIWVGGGLGLVLVVVFIFIYRRFSRE